ncbi:MAG: hypothetical protein QXR83_02195 [Archaeoglobaceae archaeon]
MITSFYSYVSGSNFYGYPPRYSVYGAYPMCPMYPEYPNTATAPITIEKAVEIAQRYLSSLNNPDLAVGEVEEYSLNFYVQYYERSTNIGAFEMLIDKNTGSIYPEPGPNMMWNTKYGMRSGMMGMMGWMHGMMGGVNTTTSMPITIEQARAYAQQYLNTYYPGATVGEIKPFYGYYHVMVELHDKPYGMLSVNGYTGQVWYHTWHGTFIQEIELD